MVNSFHHQAADRIGLDLHATGHSSDGTVEGIEHSGGRILGVQWHPEMLKDLRPCSAGSFKLLDLVDNALVPAVRYLLRREPKKLAEYGLVVSPTPWKTPISREP